jgi:2,3-diketo-5-methylthio-1-phosphopentane phosphatase/methylthioribulose-1-phosphate dehydratase
MQHVLARQLTAAMAAIHQRGWCDGTGGNFSCVLQRVPLQLLMAPSGVPKGRVRPEALIVVNADAEVCRGAGKASAETLLHLAIVEETGAGAVLHTHSQAATLLSQRLGHDQACELLLRDLEMLKGLEGVSTHATAVAVPVLPNDQNLQRLSSRARPLLADAPHGLLIAGHGLYAWGKDLASAERHLEILEFLLEQRWRELLLDPEGCRPRRISGISHVLLDIEGTTCPVSFVGEVLFPYAAERLESYLAEHGHEPEIAALVAELQASWRNDTEAAAAGMAYSPGASVTVYLRWLMQVDRKLTALKDLQRRIWESGYGDGHLNGPLFEDVAAALRRWHRSGLSLAVYSSGSVAAQQLLYGHSSAGDLRPLFSHWFDTRIGLKQQPQSYAAICDQLGVEANKVLFISDALSELEAAQAAGMAVLFSDRPGNPQKSDGGFERITEYSTLQIIP